MSDSKQAIRAIAPEDHQGQRDQHRVQSILEACRRAGADQAEVAINRSVGLSTTARLREAETLEFTRDHSLSLTVYLGQRKAAVSSGDLSDEACDAAIKRAIDIARFTESDTAAGLAPADRMARAPIELGIWHPWETNATSVTEQAIALESQALDADPALENSEGATISTESSSGTYGNSHGFIGTLAGSRHQATVSLIAGRGDQMQRDYAFWQGCQPPTAVDLQRVAQEAATRTIARQHPEIPPTGRLPVIFEPRVARSLWRHLIGALSGGALYRQASFLADSLGQQLCPDFVQIAEQPHAKGGLASSWFDGDGVATQARQIIDAGRINGYFLSHYAAQRLGLETTGNAGGVRNLIVAPGEHDLNGLIAQLDRGIVITELMGQGVNLLTGDYSRGAGGYWVEHGERANAVNEFTIAGNLRDIFGQIVALGSDQDDAASVRTPSLLIDGMTIAGRS